MRNFDWYDLFFPRIYAEKFRRCAQKKEVLILFTALDPCKIASDLLSANSAENNT